MSKYQSSTHVTYNICYHVVFCPKYRFNLLRGAVSTFLKELLHEKTEISRSPLDTYRKRP